MRNSQILNDVLVAFRSITSKTVAPRCVRIDSQQDMTFPACTTVDGLFSEGANPSKHLEKSYTISGLAFKAKKMKVNETIPQRLCLGPQYGGLLLFKSSHSTAISVSRSHAMRAHSLRAQSTSSTKCHQPARRQLRASHNGRKTRNALPHCFCCMHTLPVAS